MVELIVLYKTPNDPEHFEKYYREVHGPMTTKLAGVRNYSYGPVRAVDGCASEFFWYWLGTFDSTQAAIDAMASSVFIRVSRKRTRSVPARVRPWAPLNCSGLTWAFFTRIS